MSFTVSMFSILWYSHLLDLQIQFKYTSKRLNSFLDSKFSLDDSWEIETITCICDEINLEREYLNIIK